MTPRLGHSGNSGEIKEVKIRVRLGRLHCEKAARNDKGKHRAGRTAVELLKEMPAGLISGVGFSPKPTPGSDPQPPPSLSPGLGHNQLRGRGMERT